MGTVRQPLATQAELDTESGLRASGDSARALLDDPRFTDARPPTGGAGGVLSGGYPDPGFAVDMAEQSELQTEITNRAADVDAEEAARIAADAAHAALTNNPHAVTKAQVGLANVTNDAQETPAGAQSKVDAAIAALLDSAPGTLDTLNELAAALGDDPNFATTLTNALALKAPIASPTFTGTVTLPGDPGAALVAAPKQYVDAQAAAAQAASQPADSDLTAIAELAGQTAFGRSFLALADAAAARVLTEAAADVAVVKLAGAQTITGLKTFDGIGIRMSLPTGYVETFGVLVYGEIRTPSISTPAGTPIITLGEGQTGLNGNAAVPKAAAIASPTSDVVGTKAAIDAIRVALTNIGITL